MKIKDFQENILNIFGERDKKRGLSGSFNHLVEEIGELSQALRKKDKIYIEKEFSDVFAWLCTCANLSNINIEEILKRYIKKCPNCQKEKCKCPEREGLFGK